MSFAIGLPAICEGDNESAENNLAGTTRFNPAPLAQYSQLFFSDLALEHVVLCTRRHSWHQFYAFSETHRLYLTYRNAAPDIDRYALYTNIASISAKVFAYLSPVSPTTPYLARR